MTILFMLGGASTGVISVTPIPFDKMCALLMADEVAVGTSFEIAMEVIDDTGNYALDEPAQVAVYGYDALGAGTRTAIQPLALMGQYGSSNVWVALADPIDVAGTYEVVVVGKTGGVAFAATRALSVRPKFDPIALAVDDVFAARMGADESTLTQP